jgi:hypothetical protein
MTDNELRVLKGFLGLNELQKANVIDRLTTYQNASILTKHAIEISIKSQASVGPKNSICDCCGR